MHPVLIILPAAVLIFGPRWWVNKVLTRNNREDGRLTIKAADLARELLDKHGLQSVKVEVTDRGDHYDPLSRAIRLGRDKYDRRTLTAVTTAAHEVSHALQHANDYGPFLWRTHLAKLAQVASEVGGGLLLAVPVTALITRNTVPPAIIAMAALSVLGSGVAAQLAALPSELDASFNRALPMLRAGYIDACQAEEAHRILLACSLTYVASSLVSVIHFWPWIGGIVRRPAPVRPTVVGLTTQQVQLSGVSAQALRPSVSRPRSRVARVKVRTRTGESLLRHLLKPLIRGFFVLTR